MGSALRTPIRRLTERIWVKDEGRADAIYGGNKVRKLGPILDDAVRRGATDLITAGGPGSHHVVATAIHGAARGLRTHALLFAQPDSPHVRANLARIQGLCASVGRLDGGFGLVRTWLRLRRSTGKAPYVVQVGGSSARGAAGWIAGGIELAEQVRAGDLPRPARVYVALGTGGTAAGLLVGLALGGLDTELVGVRIVEPWIANGLRVRELAARAAWIGGHRARIGRFRVDPRFLCGGYGRADARIDAALAAATGLPLERTYTAKALAAVLADDRADPADVVFVQTAPAVEPPPTGVVPADLEDLLLPG